jgi:hypothetical protein
VTYTTEDPRAPLHEALTEEDVFAVLASTAADVVAQVAEILGYGIPAGGEFDDEVANYERRVAEGQPYENTVDREEFRRRFGV